MQPGEIWCGDFTLPHTLAYTSAAYTTGVDAGVHEAAQGC